MRHCAAIVFGIGLGLIALGGCSSTMTAQSPRADAEVFMGAMSQESEPVAAGRPNATLVAHDVLGGVIFNDYVAFVRAYRLDSQSETAIVAVPDAAD